MRNVGWDEQPGVLERRAKEMLRMASVPESDVRAIVAVTGRSAMGSACEVAIWDAEALDRAAVSIEAVRHCYLQDRPVWMSAARTRAELQPVRQMHRLAEFLSDVLDTAGSPARGTRDAASRTPIGVWALEATVRRDAEAVALAA